MQNKITNSSNGAKKFTTKSASDSQSKSANGNKSKSVKADAKGKKTATDKSAEKRKTLALASFQAAYENHQKIFRNK